MLNSINKTVVLLLMSIICLNASAQLTIVKNGKAKTEIAIVDDNSANNAAAKLLQDFISRITGAVLPLSPTTGNGTHIIIGEQSSKVGEDGFEIVCEKGILHIKTGGDKGSIYGVVTLLEDVLGVKYYAKDFYTLDKRPTITIPALHRSESPAFRYRQTQSYGYEDPIYKMWFRLEEPKELFIGNMWVHTFNRILPSKRFGKEHPEEPVLVAGGLGPYGAYLADGSEYTGAYGIDILEDPGFQEVHLPRIEVLVGEGIDLFALETLPRLDEARALASMVTALAPQAQCWVSFHVRPDGSTLADGTPLAEAAAWAEQEEIVVAVGVNCVAPGVVGRALPVLRAATNKPLVAYPNAGDLYDPATKTWQSTGDGAGIPELAPSWIDAGARLVGGCCRTRPAQIRQLARAVCP